MSATTVAVMQQWTRKHFRDRDDVYSDIYENRQFNAIYLTMLVMAGLIALLGLLINSPAVIIGAMLISPLMGPILSCGLALTLADWDLGKKGFRNVVYSVVEVLLITALVASLSPLKDATPEILARSNPNLMDLLIAFFSGVAGSIALTSKSKSGLTIIPGVVRGQFLVGRAQLKFTRNSERLDRSGAADAHRLAELSKRGAESAIISFAGPSPLNERRARAIEAILKVPTKSIVESSMKLGGDQALVILQQNQSGESTHEKKTTEANQAVP